MKWNAVLWNAVWVLIGLLFVKNGCNYWAAYAHSRGIDSDYIALANVSGFLCWLAVLVVIAVGFFRATFTVPASRSIALVLALLLPSQEWPEQEWKIDFNADRYNEMIAREKSEPKIVVLDRIESASSINGTIYTYIIYDESDQLGLADRLRSSEWRSTVPEELNGVIGQVCPVAIRKIRLHYFYVMQNCT
jgi:hypothetical protein